MKHKLRVVIYVRVSTLEQAKEGYSVQEQIKRLTKYCEAMGWTIVKVYVDAGESGASLERPSLQELINEIGTFEKVVTYKLDRLSRSQRDTLELIHDIFIPNGVEYVSMTENFDTSSPYGRAMLSILAVFAELERSQITERMIMGKVARSEKGLYHGSANIPIGYDYIDGELKVNEYEAMQIKEAYNMFLNNHSMNNILETFKDKKYTHKKGSWSNPTVKKVLSSKTYIGYVKYMEKWNKGHHSHLVSLEDWQEVQKKLTNYTDSNPDAFKYTSALSGLLVCKRCGTRYIKKTNNSNGKKYFYYWCNAKTAKVEYKDINCNNKNYKMDTLDELIFDEIRHLKLNPNAIQKIKESVIKPDNSDKIHAIENRISDINKQSSNLIDLYSLQKVDVNMLQGKIDKLSDEKEQLQSQLEEMLNDDLLSVEETLEILSDFDSIIERGSLIEIRDIINKLIKKIEIDGDDQIIHWTFA